MDGYSHKRPQRGAEVVDVVGEPRSHGGAKHEHLKRHGPPGVGKGLAQGAQVGLQRGGELQQLQGPAWLQ